MESMVIRDFDVERIAILPYQANTELIIDPHAELALPFGLQGFQPIPRWNAKVVQSSCRIQHKKLSES